EALEIFLEKTAEYGMAFQWYGVTRYCEYNPVEEGLGLRFCSACSITIAIEPDGTVIPCQSYYEPLGNMLKDGWESIWNHSLCIEIRERKYAWRDCLDCPFFTACGAGCPLEAKVRPLSK
ncbi:MAG: radical SAM protein, partial [Thermoprotei archaeon]